MLRLEGKVDLDGAGWEAGLSRLEHTAHRTAERVGEIFKGLAIEAFGVYGIEQAIRKTAEYGATVIDTARRLGVATDALQEFSFAAKTNGADLQALTGFIEKLNSARIDEKKIPAFAKLGVSVQDLKSLSAEDIMMKISASVQNQSPQQIIGPLREVGGRGAGELIGMLTSNLEELRKEAEAAGMVMKADTLAGLKAVTDRFEMLAQMLVVKVGPAVVYLMEKLLKIVNLGRAGGGFAETLQKEAPGRVLSFLTSGLPGIGPLFSRLGEFTKDKPLSQAIKDAFASAKEQFAALNKEDEDFIARITNSLSKQLPPDFGGGEDPEKAIKIGKPKIETDSLIKVGNFLGSNGVSITDIAKQQLSELQKIRALLGAPSGSGSTGNGLGIPSV